MDLIKEFRLGVCFVLAHAFIDFELGSRERPAQLLLVLRRYEGGEVHTLQRSMSYRDIASLRCDWQKAGATFARNTVEEFKAFLVAKGIAL